MIVNDHVLHTNDRVIKKVDSITNVIKKVLSRLMGLIISLGLCVFLLACGSDSQSNSNADNSSQGNAADEAVSDLKKWTYYKDEANQPHASIISQNYYTTNKGENIYGSFTMMNNNGTDGGWLSLFVQGGSDDVPRTIISFPQTERNFIVSFDGSNTMLWPAFPSQSRKILIIDNFTEWLNAIQNTNTCTISLVSEEGEMTFIFDTKGLRW